MLEKLKSLFRKQGAAVLAQQELEDAQRSLLEAQTGRDYAVAMCAYHEARIKRLNAVLLDFARKA